MRVEELFAAPAEVADHPAVKAAARIGAELLEPHAAAADDPSIGVSAAHLARLAEAGLLSVREPAALGGYEAGARVEAEVVELLSGSCGATWFVTTQHEGATAMCRRLSATPSSGGATYGPAAKRYGDQLGSARQLAGVATAHLRRPGRPTMTATQDPAGNYRLTGRADWVTGWGLVNLLLVAGTTTDDRFVFGLVPAVERDGSLAAGPRLRLAVMGGTRTVPLQLTDLLVTADDVLLTVDGPVWRRHDRYTQANAKPGALGPLRRALVELERHGEQRSDPVAVQLARELAKRAATMRKRAYQLMHETPAAERVEERTALRGALAELTVRAAHALIAARAGRAMLLSSPEQRWAREAGFHLIQAQTPHVRAAQYAAFGGL